MAPNAMGDPPERKPKIHRDAQGRVAEPSRRTVAARRGDAARGKVTGRRAGRRRGAEGSGGGAR